jgi:hypothetical protein
MLTIFVTYFSYLCPAPHSDADNGQCAKYANPFAPLGKVRRNRSWPRTCFGTTRLGEAPPVRGAIPLKKGSYGNR